MNYRLGLVIVAWATLAAAAAGCTSTESDAPIPQRAGRAAASGVPAPTNNSATVKGGLSTPTGL